MQINRPHNDKNTGSGARGLFEATKRVFTTSWIYPTIAIAVTAIFWVLFASLDQLLFFSPILTFYLPNDAIANFVLSSITAAILGVVISMNVYALNQRQDRSSPMKDAKNLRLTNTRTFNSASSLFSGSSLNVLSTVCASCSSLIGLVFTSLLGTALGASVSVFLSNYQTPLRIVSILILLWSWYSISKSLSSKGYCHILDNSGNN